MIAADLMRFQGENVDLLWSSFAAFGLGEGAFSDGADDTEPVPDFTSPYQDAGTLTFQPVGPGGQRLVAELYVGDYEARSRAVADTDPSTPIGETVDLTPGTYDLLTRADGYGTHRFTATVEPGEVSDLTVPLQPNLASAYNGAQVTGDGVNLDQMIDDTEATNWVAAGGPVQGREVTVQLAPAEPSDAISRVQVSAMLRPDIGDEADPGAQNRFTALRQFEILTCAAGPGVDCNESDDFTSVFASSPDAFPADVPRPKAPRLIMRKFEIPRTRASHVMLRVLENQCTGTEAFRGQQDHDPRHDTDCVSGSPWGDVVRAAELQVFDS